MAKIKNKHYRKFLDEGEIDLVTPADFDAAIEAASTGIYGKHRDISRALLVTLYYTGCRPAEALKVCGKDIDTSDHTFLKVKLKTLKMGRPRTVYIPRKLPYVADLEALALRTYPDMLLFYPFISKSVKLYKTRNGEVKTFTETSTRLRYYFRKWFAHLPGGAVSPYFLRHNRFSSLALEGAAPQDIQLLKGAKDLSSVSPYLHMSTKKARDIGRKIR